jgi:hypothetical protein
LYRPALKLAQVFLRRFDTLFHIGKPALHATK